MFNSKDRRSFVVDMTLTELAFVLFFILLMATATYVTNVLQGSKKQAEENQQLAAHNHEMEARLTEAEKMFGATAHMSPDEAEAYFTELVQAAEQINQVSQLKEKVRRLEDDRARLKPIEDVINENYPDTLTEKQIADEIKTSKDFIESLAKELQGNNPDKAQQLDTIAVVDHFNQIRKEIKDLRGQNIYLHKVAYGEGGRDKRPCWVDDSGKVEYLYMVTIGEKNILLERAWPDERNEDVKSIPAVIGLVGKRMSLDEFNLAARPIFDWSVKHDCRHYVKIWDNTITKGPFKNQLFGVEEYFYKLRLN